jgi:predicted PurR-regulated permease PerM
MTRRATWSSMVVTLAALVVVMAGMSIARGVIVPFLVAAFLAVILTPPMRWLERRGLPTAVALLIVFLGVLVLGAGVVAIVGASASEFLKDYNQYQEGVTLAFQNAKQWLQEHNFSLPPDDKSVEVELKEALQWGRNALQQVSNVLTFLLIVLIGLAFMLLESSRFPDKIRAALGADHPAVRQVSEILGNLRRYLVIKTFTSLLTGVFVGIFTYLMGIDYVFLWGLLAFLLNYIPYIGSTLAGIPAVLLVLATGDVVWAMWTVVGYLVINNVVSNVIEPPLMGQGLGLSTLVVFISLAFWGFVLGAVGMLLAAPLTMVCKIVLAEYEETRWLADLMSSKAPPATQK